MKRLFTLLLVTLLTFIMLIGCTPSQYTKGVAISSSYPEDELPIYDDAIVFSYEEDDDDKVELRFGSKDDVDDVTDFYKELFEDHKDEFIILSEKDKSDRYRVSGYIAEEYLKFKIYIREASGKYEEKLYDSEVKIDIEPVDKLVIDKLFETNNSYDSYITEISSSNKGKVVILADYSLLDVRKYKIYIDNKLVTFGDSPYIKLDDTLFDDSLKQLKIEELDKNNNHLATYTIMVYNGYDASSILQSCKKVDALVIYDSKLDKEDMKTLGELSNLRKLHLINCSMSSINDLSNLKNLDYLQMFFCNYFGGFDAISGLSNLQTLHIQSTGNNDVDAIGKLTNLKTLTLSYVMDLVDISFISSLTNLESLNINCVNDLSDISPLEELTNLTKIEINSSGIRDVDVLSNMTKLKELDLSFNYSLENIDALANLKSLEILDLMYCEALTDISALEGLDGLYQLSLFGCENITDYTPVNGLRNCDVMK